MTYNQINQTPSYDTMILLGKKSKKYDWMFSHLFSRLLWVRGIVVLNIWNANSATGVQISASAMTT